MNLNTHHEKACTMYTEVKSRNIGPNLFFSLDFTINNKYISNKNEDLIEFYESFVDSDALLEWMKCRPRGRTEIFEYGEPGDIAVVIPTANVEGEFARRCREVIFKGLHVIFVESAQPGDIYFNYSRSCNIGIKKT